MSANPLPPLTSITRSIVIVLASYSLAGCDFATSFLSEYASVGSNLGYMNCLDRNKNSGLDESTLKQQCLRKHEQRATVPVGGAARFYRINGEPHFSGQIKNFSKDKIITSYVISVLVGQERDSSGKYIVESHEVSGRWIEPEMVDTFTLDTLKRLPPFEKIKADIDSKSKNYFKDVPDPAANPFAGIKERSRLENIFLDEEVLATTFSDSDHEYQWKVDSVGALDIRLR